MAFLFSSTQTRIYLKEEYYYLYSVLDDLQLKHRDKRKYSYTPHAFMQFNVSELNLIVSFSSTVITFGDSDITFKMHVESDFSILVLSTVGITQKQIISNNTWAGVKMSEKIEFLVNMCEERKKIKINQHFYDKIEESVKIRKMLCQI